MSSATIWLAILGYSVFQLTAYSAFQVLDKYIDCVSMTTEVWDSSNIVVFLHIIREIVDKKNKGGGYYSARH